MQPEKKRAACMANEQLPLGSLSLELASWETNNARILE